MKIAILTQPLHCNYGGILQNYALQTVLRRMGYQVTTLDPQRYMVSHRWEYFLLAIRHILGFVFKGHKNSLLTEYNKDKRKRKLGKYCFPFIDKHINRLEFKDLYKEILSTDYDCFVVGSDQVWRKAFNGNFPNMFLDFTTGWNVKRIAYAASFGTDHWEGDDDETAIGKECLQKFDIVTVREESGVALCKKIFNVEAHHVLDPTLLLSMNDYVDDLKIESVRKSCGNLMVYILDYNDEVSKLVNDVAQQKHLTPFRANSEYENREAPIEKRIQPPVEEWLRGFMDADYVITDSFHACVFSIIFRKQFYVYGNIKRGMSRYLSLFEQLGIEGRLIKSIDDISNLSPIDYVSVGERLRKMQAYSMKFLMNI